MPENTGQHICCPVRGTSMCFPGNPSCLVFHFDSVKGWARLTVRLRIKGSLLAHFKWKARECHFRGTTSPPGCFLFSRFHLVTVSLCYSVAMFDCCCVDLSLCCFASVLLCRFISLSRCYFLQWSFACFLGYLIFFFF